VIKDYVLGCLLDWKVCSQEHISLITYIFNDFFSSSSFSIKVLKFSALFDIFLFYDWPFLHARNLQKNLVFSTLIF